MRLPKLNVSAPAVLLWALVVYLSPPDTLWAVCLPVLVHELGHAAAIMLLGGEVTGLSIEAGGLKISYKGARETWQAGLIAAAGPLAGILAAALFSSAGEKGSLAAGVSILLSLFNLIPTRPLDGGKIAELIFPGICGQLAFFCRAVLLAAGLYLSAKGVGAGLLAAGIFICIAANAGNSPRHVL